VLHVSRRLIAELEVRKNRRHGIGRLGLVPARIWGYGKNAQKFTVTVDKKPWVS